MTCLTVIAQNPHLTNNKQWRFHAQNKTLQHNIIDTKIIHTSNNSCDLTESVILNSLRKEMTRIG